MAGLIREKKISPVELAEAHLAKIERLNPKLNAFVQVDAERVRREARRAEVGHDERQGLWGRYMAFRSASRVRLKLPE